LYRGSNRRSSPCLARKSPSSSHMIQQGYCATASVRRFELYH
jgi:hypothetical protein